ncbi:hypothetical protein N5D61_24100 [Pseudomonas sp. GD03842]|uniref:DUF6911 family protein n=1 Tax=Pseudomonas sp. GD03842 TaxID=2975385 RepID=UPI00244721E8|nr:hypothetical protein [Pseudomonas sp. GD03842]MDH0749411.1 hypothetical protein [Pseudomonas sp. GD03842]
MKFLISWTLSSGGNTTGGHNDVEGWDEVLCRLESMKLHAGSMCLEWMDAPETGPYSMDLIADDGRYLITLLEATRDDSEVRSFTNPAAVAEMVCMLGDLWDARYLTSDFGLVRNLFNEFFETGDVSREVLN